MNGGPFGWTGKILLADLASGKIETLRLPQETYAEYLGGRGLCGYFLDGCAELAGAASEPPLVIAAGPLTGTTVPGAGPCHAAARSPLTGALGDGVCPGKFGTELKRAGWDAVVLSGRSPRLCGLEIDDDRVRLADASGLAGQETKTIHARLLAAQGGRATLVSGPAADSGCRFACLVADGRRIAGRGGLGRAAGLKRLKYVAVRGTGRVRIADPDDLKRANEDILRLVSASPALTGEHGLANFGTGCLFDLTDSRRMMPTDNFRRTRFPPAGSLNAPAYAERYRPERAGCPGCPAPCLRIAADGRSLPDFSAMSHFTALIGNADMECAMRANDLCLRLGMDPVSAAATLACRGEITGESPAGDRLGKILRGTAAGTELAEGSARYATRRGRPELSMSVKGLELPAFDPRGAYGTALGYAVSTRGGCSRRANAVFHEILRKPVATDRFGFEGKARIVKLAEDAYAAADSLEVCEFLFLAVSLEEYARAYAAVTGIRTAAGELMAAGERIDRRERIFNARFGFAAQDDDLPRRFFTEPGTGSSELPVPPIPREAFLAARAAYYRIRGLSPEGLPEGKNGETDSQTS